MSEGIDLAELAMINDMARLRVISQNLANLSTTGYRRDAASAVAFGSQVLESQRLLGALVDVSTPHIEVRAVHEPGTLRFTGNPLDVAIDGNAFFVIESEEGEAFSRDGAFRLDAAGQLVTAAGRPVLATSGPIRLTGPEPRIDQHGAIWEDENFMGQLRLVEFTEPELLVRAGGYFLPGAAQTAASVIDNEESLVRQAYLENSNVQVSREMVMLLDVMRHFEASQRVIRSYDEMLDTAISTIASF